jgi:hypothetical protein
MAKHEEEWPWRVDSDDLYHILSSNEVRLKF